MNTHTLKQVQNAIQHVRYPVDIIAVTKTHSFESVYEAYTQGFRHFGENRVEEAITKINLSRQNNLNNICWHMIGHVQSRKIRDVVIYFDSVDSVDSIELLEKLDREAHIQQKKLRVLLEVNISQEAGKYGFKDLDVQMLRSIETKNVYIDGIMTMAPLVQNPDENRNIFKDLRELSKVLQEEITGFGHVLSMGTSADYIVALEEGATEIRLGGALFGPRK